VAVDEYERKVLEDEPWRAEGQGVPAAPLPVSLITAESRREGGLKGRRLFTAHSAYATALRQLSTLYYNWCMVSRVGDRKTFDFQLELKSVSLFISNLNSN
jgi:hypothetical protein